MPDTYLRSKQVLSLELQEECLRHIRDTGELDYDLSLLPVMEGSDDERTRPRSSNKRKVEAEVKEYSPGDEYEVSVLTTNRLHEAKESYGRPSSQGAQVEEAASVHSSSSQSSEEDSSSDGESMDLSVPAVEEFTDSPLRVILCNTVSHKYHATDEEVPTMSACHRAKANLIVKPFDEFAKWASSRESSCCELCFPAPLDIIFDACPHICGRQLPGGLCGSRCREVHNSYLVDHDCGRHELPEEKFDRQAKRRKAATATAVDELHEFVAQEAKRVV